MFYLAYGYSGLTCWVRDILHVNWGKPNTLLVRYRERNDSKMTKGLGKV
jgi:hypothetical protein